MVAAMPMPQTTTSRIVTGRKSRVSAGNAPDLTPEEYQRRGDAADAMFQAIAAKLKERKP